MDEKRNSQILNDPELLNVLGSAAGRVDLPSTSALNPTMAPKPRRPTTAEVPQTPAGCIAPIFPIVPESDVHLYQREDRRADDVMGNYQKGKIDPELNELALREVARERGITVEQLLSQNPDKTLEKKLEFANMDQQAPPTPPARTQTMSVEEARRMVAEADQAAIVEKEKQMSQLVAEAERDDRPTRSFEKPMAPPPKPKSKLPPRKIHPLLAELRKEFAIDAIPPLKVAIRQHTFEMLPPPSSLHPWLLTKIANAEYVNSPQAVQVAVRGSVISAALYAIDGIPIAEIFGLTPDPVPPLHQIPPELRELMAQTVWEMIAEVSTLEEVFTFDPQLVAKLFQQYSERFKDDRFTLESDIKLHRFACPVAECTEAYNLEPRAEPYYCKLHGVRMEDAGSLQEVNQIPLL